MTETDDIERRSARRREGAVVEVFDSLERENEAEHRRRAGLSREAREAELAAILDWRFGSGWRTEPIRKIWRCEIVDWI